MRADLHSIGFEKKMLRTLLKKLGRNYEA